MNRPERATERRFLTQRGYVAANRLPSCIGRPERAADAVAFCPPDLRASRSPPCWLRDGRLTQPRNTAFASAAHSGRALLFLYPGPKVSVLGYDL